MLNFVVGLDPVVLDKHGNINDEKDTSLIDKMTTETELSGLLNLALISLNQLIKDNGICLY